MCDLQNNTPFQSKTVRQVVPRFHFTEYPEFILPNLVESQNYLLLRPKSADYRCAVRLKSADFRREGSADTAFGCASARPALHAPPIGRYTALRQRSKIRQCDCRILPPLTRQIENALRCGGLQARRFAASLRRQRRCAPVFALTDTARENQSFIQTNFHVPVPIGKMQSDPH